MEGRFSESLREAHTGRDLDPMAVISRFAVLWCSYHARRFEEAHRFATAVLENEPRNLMVLYGSSFVLSQLGRHAEAIQAAEQCVELMGKASHTPGRLAHAHAVAGDLESAQTVFDDMQKLAERRYVSPYHLALVTCQLDRPEEALGSFERAYQTSAAQ